MIYVGHHFHVISSLLEQFKAYLQQWKTWDSITVIQNQQLIKDYLWSVWQQGLSFNVRLGSFFNYPMSDE